MSPQVVIEKVLADFEPLLEALDTRPLQLSISPDFSLLELVHHACCQAKLIFDARRILLSSFNNVNSAALAGCPPQSGAAVLALGATKASPPSVTCELPVDKPVPSRGTGATHTRCALCRELRTIQRSLFHGLS